MAGSPTAPFTLALLTNSQGVLFLLDVCLNDTHTFKASVTADPVEDGSTISDNIINDPIEVTMECIVSNAPINAEVITARNGAVSPANDAYAFLMKCRADREPISVRTSLDTFDSMGIENITIPRATGRGDELRFTLGLKQILIVSNLRVRTATPLGNGIKKTNKPPKDSTFGSILLDHFHQQWLDPRINQWRHTALPGSAGPVPISGDTRTLAGFWSLIRGAPDGVPVRTWANLSPGGRSQLEQTLFDGNKTTPTPSFFSVTSAVSLVVAPKGSYVIRDDS